MPACAILKSKVQYRQQESGKDRGLSRVPRKPLRREASRRPRDQGGRAVRQPVGVALVSERPEARLHAAPEIVARTGVKSANVSYSRAGMFAVDCVGGI